MSGVRYAHLPSLRSKLGKQPQVATKSRFEGQHPRLCNDKSADLSEQSGESERRVHSERNRTERAAYGIE